MIRASQQVILFLACVAAAPAAAADERIEYPRTRRVKHVDEYFGVKVADPYRWLEDDVRQLARGGRLGGRRKQGDRRAIWSRSRSGRRSAAG